MQVIDPQVIISFRDMTANTGALAMHTKNKKKRKMPRRNNEMKNPKEAMCGGRGIEGKQKTAKKKVKTSLG